DDAIDAEDVRLCVGGAGGATQVGLFRPGVPFRVLAEEAERAIIEGALAHYGGQMTATARGLGLERSHLYKKCRALGLRGDKGEGEAAPGPRARIFLACPPDEKAPPRARGARRGARLPADRPGSGRRAAARAPLARGEHGPAGRDSPAHAR